MAFLNRFLRSLPLLLLSPVLVAIAALTLALTDLFRRLVPRPASTAPSSEPRPRSDPRPKGAVSVVIPNWNGKELLEKYLPSVIEALAGNPDNEILIVDNGSTDGSAEFLRTAHPSVRVLALPVNLGFGGGSNEGFREARNGIVVLLNTTVVGRHASS